MWTKRDLDNFEKAYDSSHQDRALKERGDFLESFPLKKLGGLTLREYVTGTGQPTFCNFVESRTRNWALIQGADASKFGVYYGKEGDDPVRKYRFTKKFGQNRREAFQRVKAALQELVRFGKQEAPNFEAIDRNPLSQLFKAKILSLYFPEKFVAVCSSEHLDALATLLKIDHASTSEIQCRLIEYKNSNSRTRRWSNPKFMRFLYETLIPEFLSQGPKIGAPGRRKPRKVNFQELQRQWGEIGRIAEEYALVWERQRLRGEGMAQLAGRILDCRDRPGYGYDFRSFDSPKHSRLIEVKALGRVRGEKARRFFLSENERAVSAKRENLKQYYFYLVFFEKDQSPSDLLPVLAKDLYKFATLAPSAFEVRFGYPM